MSLASSSLEMAPSGIARDINRDIVLELIRARQPIARVDLSRKSGLQPSTVSLIVEQLLAEKWIVEGKTVARPRGRKPTLLSLSSEVATLAVELHPNQATVAVIDLHDRLLTQEHIPVLSDPAKSIEILVKAIEQMRKKHPEKQLVGIGISVPGRVDPKLRRLILAPNLKWHGVDIRGILERECALPVEMENEANVCLIHELWSGKLHSYRNAVLVSISEGIGAAILVNGQIVYGKSGLAGEFGHIALDPNGPLCGCGRRGCWEMFASTSATLRFYAEASQSPAAITIGELLSMAEDGDEYALRALRQQAIAFGKGLQVVITALAPEVVLVTGDVNLAWSEFASIVQAELSSHMLAGDPPQLSIITKSDLARLRGAAAMVLQRHSGYHSFTRFA